MRRIRLAPDLDCGVLGCQRFLFLVETDGGVTLKMTFCRNRYNGEDSRCSLVLSECWIVQLVAARCKGRRRTLVCGTQLSLCRCCRCTVSLSPCALHFGSEHQTRVCLAFPARPYSTVCHRRKQHRHPTRYYRHVVRLLARALRPAGISFLDFSKETCPRDVKRFPWCHLKRWLPGILP